MTNAILNRIIVFCIIGIAIVIPIKQLFKQNQKIESSFNYNRQVIISPTIVISDNIKANDYQLINCNSKFFDIKISSKRYYNLKISQVDGMDLKKTDVSFFTTVTNATGSSILLTTTINDKNKSDSKLSCTTKGIVGLPFDIQLVLKEVLKDQTVISNFSSDVFDIVTIPPDNKLVVNSSWTDKITFIPNFFELNLNSKVIGKSYQNYPQINTKETYTVKTTLDLPNLGLVNQQSNNIAIDGQIAEDIGVIELNVTMDNLPLVTLKLTKYLP